eukprot:CAMPEP_0172659020 /NCGR_PEP_ID=MMETSP1074-20121228/3145_1 /TAXON_ID=2916 /ORGANISM="Ceratium fusus, Strain PA161109" /LENGTH=61 /DNA_ID=CAMNT_0013474407 /DNA_START=95 /DNA_END=280 /DNA_ORIENTATION=+
MAHNPRPPVSSEAFMLHLAAGVLANSAVSEFWPLSCTSGLCLCWDIWDLRINAGTSQGARM